MVTVRRLVVVVCLVASVVASAALAAPTKQDARPSRFIVTIASPTEDVGTVARALASEYQGTVLSVWTHAVRGFWVEMAHPDAMRLRNDARVATIETDVPVALSGSGTYGSAEPAGTPWHLTRISHRALNPGPADLNHLYPHDGRVEGTGQGVRVYLIDSGIQYRIDQSGAEQGHSEFIGRDVLPNVRMTEHLATSGSLKALLDEKKVENDPVLPEPASSIPAYPCGRALTTTDNAVHGTRTGSLVVGNTVGVARGARLIPVVSSVCVDHDLSPTSPQTEVFTTTALLIAAFDWIAEHKSLAENVNVPAVVSMSAYFLSDIQCFRNKAHECVAEPDVTVVENAINRVIDLGVPVVASANNWNSDACGTIPPRFSRRGGRPNARVISVGATDGTDRRWLTVDPNKLSTDPSEGNGSNFGQCVDIFAPGADVRQAGVVGAMDTSSGTSFSAPIVAGLVARLLSEDPTLFTAPPRAATADRVWARLRVNATEIDPVAHDLGDGSPGLLAYLGGVTFLEQPQSVSVRPAEPVTLKVSVHGSGVAYQWYRGPAGDTTSSVAITGANADTVTENAPSAGEVTYWCRVSRGNYVGDSRVATVTVINELPLAQCPRPVFVRQPTSGWNELGQPNALQPSTHTAFVKTLGRTYRYQLMELIRYSGRDSNLPNFKIEPVAGQGGDVPTSETCVPGTSPCETASMVTVTVPGRNAMQHRWISGQEPPLRYPGVFWLELTPVEPGAACTTRSDTFQVRPCAATEPFQLGARNFGGATEIEMMNGSVAHDVPAKGYRIRWYIGDPKMPLRVELDDRDADERMRAVTLHGKSIYPHMPGIYWGEVGNECSTSSASIRIPEDITGGAPFQSCTWTIEAQFDGGAYGDPATWVPDGTRSIGLRGRLPASAVNAAVPPGAAFSWTGASGSATSQSIPKADIDWARQGPRRITVSATDRGAGCTLTHTFKFCFDLSGKGPRDSNAKPAADVETTAYIYDENAILQVIPPQSLDGSSFSYEWKRDGEVISGETGSTLALLGRAVSSYAAFQVTVRETAGACPAQTITFKVFASMCDSLSLVAGRCQLVMNPWVIVKPTANVILRAKVIDEVTGERADEGTTYKWYEVINNVREQNPFRTGVGVEGAEVPYKVVLTVPYAIDVVAETPGGCSITRTIQVRPQGPPIAEHTPSCARRPRPFRHRLGSAPEPVSVLAFEPGELVTLGVEEEREGYAYEWYRRLDAVEESIGAGSLITLQMNAPAAYWYVESNAFDYTPSEEVDARRMDSSATAGATVIPITQSVAAGNYATITANLDSSERLTGDTLRFKWRRGSLYDDTRPVIFEGQTVTLTNVFDDADFWCRIEQYVGANLVATYDTPFASVFIRCTNTVHGLMSAHPSFIAAGDTSMIVPSVHGKLPYLDWWTLADDGVTRIPYGSAEMRPFNIRPSVAKTIIGATATDACGTVGTVDPATVYVCVPSIVPPQSMTLVGENGRADLSVDVTPALPSQTVDIQWYDDEDQTRVNSLGSGLSFQTPPVSPGATKSYVARVTAQCTPDRQYATESAAAVVHACANPQIASQPSDYWSTNPGSAAGVSLYANGTDLTYQWYEGERGDTSKPWPRTDRDATFYPTRTTTYWCRVTSEGLCVTDSESATIRVCSSPVITAQPQSTRVFPSETATLSVAIDAGNNTEPITYQWQQQNASGSWVNISGATESTFTTPAFGGTLQEANYRVLVKAGLCPAESVVATVSMCTYPAVVSGQDRNVRHGESVFLSLPNLSPVENKTITWYRGQSEDDSQPMRTGEGSNLLNETGPVTGTAYFWARFEHLGCVSRTETYTVRACIPEITTQPAGTMVPAGTAATLTVATTPIASQTYQWYVGVPPYTTNPVPGGTAASIQVTPAAATTYWCRVTSPCGLTADSNAVTVTTCAPAEIQNIFVTPSASVPSGTLVELRVNASGLNKSYQWYQGAKGVTSSPITNGTASTLTRTITATTSYWCRVTTDGVCQKDSDAVTVSVCTNPTITTEPVSQNLFPGVTTATLTVAATSQQPATYQWYTGLSGDPSSPINGATAASITVQPSATTSYWVRVSNGGCKDDSATATVTKCVLPQEVTAKQPATNVAYNETLTLSLPTMSPAVDKQVTWYRGAVGVKTSPVASGTNASYTAAHTASATYWAEFIHNGCVSRTTAYVVNVCKPTITVQPQNALIESGQATTLSVTASGESLTYQWYVGASGNTGSPVSGGTSRLLPVSPAADTTYWVRVTGCTAANSTAATVTVCVTPTVSTPTKGMDGRVGDPAFVSVTASGPNLTYQWYKGTSGDTSAPIAGATAARHDFTLAATAYYWVKVTSTCTGGGTRTANSAAVLYSVFPTITKSPANTAIPSGGRTLLSVTANGAYLTFQWYETTGYSSTLIPGATSSTYLTPVATTKKRYWVKVISGSLSVNSNVAEVDICTGPTIESFNSSGSGDDFTFTVNVDTEQEDLVTYHWYRGTPGIPSQSTFLGEGIYRRTFMNISPLPATFWVRVFWTDESCYTDTAGKTVP